MTDRDDGGRAGRDDELPAQETIAASDPGVSAMRPSGGSVLGALTRGVLVEQLPRELASIAEAQDRARLAAERRIERILEDGAACPDLTAARLYRVIERTASSSPGDVTITRSSPPTHERLATWLAPAGPAELPRPQWSALADPSVLGVIAWRSELRDKWLADVVDDVSRARGAISTARVVSGSLPDVEEVVGAQSWFLVASVHGDFEVRRREDATGYIVHHSLTPGSKIAAGSLTSLTGARTGLCLLVSAREMETADAWAVAVEKAKYWPRLRADMPFDPSRPAEIYGFEEPVDIVEILAAQVEQLLDASTLRQAQAWWQASLPAVPRSSGATLVSRFAGLTNDTPIRGRFVGDIGWVAVPETRVLAAGGALFSIDDDLTPVLAALATNEWITASDLIAAAPSGRGEAAETLATSLASVGLVEVRRENEIWQGTDTG